MRMTVLASLVAAGLLMGCKPKEPAPAPAPKVVAKDLPSDDPLTTSRPPIISEPPPYRPPPATQPVAATGARKYTIKQGDTLIKIARAELGNEHRLKDIKAANPGIDFDKLKVGQEIYLPAK
jgi:nucleoid-associated protein YgaU